MIGATNSAWDVVGVGANSVDFVHLLPGYPQPFGSFAKMKIDRQEILCGGQMATAMSACAKLGLRARYAGVTGTDENGRRVRQELQRRGIDLTDLIIRDAQNQFAVILVDETNGERIVLWDRDERLLMRERDIPVEAIAGARVLHVDDVDQAAAIMAANVARAHSVDITSDIDRLTDRTRELIDAVTIPIFAEHVPKTVTGLSDQSQALNALRQPHHRLLCVTLGEHGAMALDDTGIHHAPAFAVEAVDTTGAGDVFRAGFIYALLRGSNTDEILQFANAAAAVSCTRLGALGGIPSLDEVESLVASGHVKT
ncbi:MAG TPA: PfkB family carbohydrate kinase [Vicinamibacterales bacterium]|nr:PfkB family carbohydrate kinase [Vicinamibacterales bacterium]